MKMHALSMIACPSSRTGSQETKDKHCLTEEKENLVPTTLEEESTKEPPCCKKCEAELGQEDNEEKATHVAIAMETVI